jgi:hypothetical protein
MLQYLIQVPTPGGRECCITLSQKDLRLLREAAVGRPLDLDNYVAYRTSNEQIAFSRRPDHAESAVIAYADLKRKLIEAEIETGERSAGSSS